MQLTYFNHYVASSICPQHYSVISHSRFLAFFYFPQAAIMTLVTFLQIYLLWY